MTMPRPRTIAPERGYAMVALLIMMAIAAVAMTAALPAWSTLTKREREAELVFRGEQYARAIALFQRKYAGAFPPNLDVLVNERFLRKKYKDPITNGDFQPIAVGEAIASAQTTSPLDQVTRGAAGRGAAGQRGGATGGSGAGSTTQPAGRSTFTLGGGQQTGQQTGGRSTFTLGSTMGAAGQAGRGGVGVAGASAGIMGVTSKSTDASLRVYKGADHYNQWLFIATQAVTQAGGRGVQTPGEGVRGGAGRPGGPAGRGGAPPPFTPFGRGQQPTGPIGGRSR